MAPKMSIRTARMFLADFLKPCFGLFLDHLLNLKVPQREYKYIRATSRVGGAWQNVVGFQKNAVKVPRKVLVQALSASFSES
ncbi:hypothetical protein FRC07_000027 [Ceratobasidium sp. 392]|nr:hypothetical protein FRC07_000027 [Ceratobasidium sp. 392]